MTRPPERAPLLCSIAQLLLVRLSLLPAWRTAVATLAMASQAALDLPSRQTVSALAEGRHRCAHLIWGFYILCVCHCLSRQLPLLGGLGLRCTVGLALALAAGRLLKVGVILACLSCSLGCWCSASSGWLRHQTVDVGSDLLLQGPAVGQSGQLSTPLLQDAPELFMAATCIAEGGLQSCLCNLMFLQALRGQT